MRRTRLVGLLSAAFVAAGLLLGPAQAERADTWAWWYSARLSGLPVQAPAPPGVPDNGLYVSSSPAGASAISAIRARVNDGASSVTIVLDLTDATGTPILGACATNDPWERVSAGNWDERPEPDCASGAVPGTVSQDATTVSFRATSLVREGILNVVIVPGVDESGLSANFTATFAPPGASAVQTNRSSTPAALDPSPNADSRAAPAPFASFTPFTPAPGLISGDRPDATIDVPPIVASRPSAQTRPARSPFAATKSAAGSVAEALIASALFGVFFLLKERFDSGRPVLGAIAIPGRRKGAEASETVSGIGRFKGPRRGAPPSL